MEIIISKLKSAKENGPEIVSILEQYSDFFTKNASSLDQLLVRYDTTRWTYLYAAVVRAKLAVASPIDSTHLTEARTFFEASDAKRLQLVRPIVRAIGNILTNKLLSQSMAMLGIPVLIAAINRLQVTPNDLTCLHVNLCQLALSARFFSPLLPFLNADILDVDADQKAYSIKDTILYFYYGGMVYAALKMWERSFNCFSMACSIPTPFCSTLLLAASKKLLVVSLIYKGEFNPTAYPLFRRWKFSLDTYKQLVEAFATSNFTSLTEAIENNSAVFIADRNYGLVKQLIACHIRCRICNLTKIFVSLSLKNLTTRAQLDHVDTAERQLLQMAASKSIFVKIDQRNGCVRFLDNPERYESPEILAELIQKMKKTMDYDLLLRRIISEEASNIALNDLSFGVPGLSAPVSKRKSPPD